MIPDPDKIVVPRKHGEVLVEPGLDACCGVLQAANLAGEWKLLGVSAAEMKERARREFLAAVKSHADAIGAEFSESALREKPWVITGHQVEFFHAGVWAKMIAVDALARRTGAAAFDLLVDHDTVSHFGFDVPEKNADGTWKRKMIAWEGDVHSAVDGARPPSGEAFEQWDSELARHSAAGTDTLAFVLSKLRRLDGTYTQWMSRARTELEAAADIHAHHVPTSKMCESASWHLFVLAWMRNAEAWTRCYNDQLAAYRAAHDIHNDHHPMPDLAREGKSIELPFWIYKVGEPRERLMLSPEGARWRSGAIAMPASGDAWAAAAEFSQALLAAGAVIRPRALTLTMFVRLCLSDLFIHGIGGALYDQITDGIMRELFGQAPSYACVSAAWLLPLGEGDGKAEPISELQHRRHHLLHNPQSAIDPFTAVKTDYAELIAQRRMLVETIARSKAENRRNGKAERREWFEQLRATNAQLHAKSPRILQRVDADIEKARRVAEQNKVTLWREYYFALHTMESLRGLIERVRRG